MQDELGEFEQNHIWDLVPRLEGVKIIGTKWIFKNTTYESWNVANKKSMSGGIGIHIGRRYWLWWNFWTYGYTRIYSIVISGCLCTALYTVLDGF